MEGKRLIIIKKRLFFVAGKLPTHWIFLAMVFSPGAKSHRFGAIEDRGPRHTHIDFMEDMRSTLR
jgi:hypothetical protein